MLNLPIVDPSGHDASLVLILIVAVIAIAIAGRLPIIGRLVRFATRAALLAVLVIVVQTRGQIDPYMARVARLLRLDDQSVVGNEVRIAMSPDGHF